jgi:nicotinamide-nucleotide amidase
MEEKIEQIGRALLDRKETIAVAESVTSGYLQAAFSQPTNASAFFQGGITAYNVGQKTLHLKVEPIHALMINGVSEKVANELAIGASCLFLSDWGIGVTGYASTLPEKSIYDLFAFYSFCFRGKIIHSKKITAEKQDAEKVQRYYVFVIIDEFFQKLKSGI